MNVVDLFSASVIDPRDEANRYRVYRAREGRLELLATTPDKQGVGVAVVTLHREGEFDDAAVGVLDTYAAPDGSGVWVINPWQKPGVRS